MNLKELLSTRELWSIITGSSSLKDKESIGEELQRFNPLFESLLDYYEKPNTNSEKKVTSTPAVKRKPFIIKLSKILDLDEWQTNELFLIYLRLDFRGSGLQLQTILKHDTQLEGFYLKLSEYYYKERLFLLKCIKYFITYWQDESCLYREQFAQVVDHLANKNIISKVINQIKDLLRKPANHLGIKGNQTAETERANQYAREMCELAEILFLYYKDFEMPLEIFQDLALLFRRHHFGASQVNQKLLSFSGIIQMQKFEIISSLILVEGIDLEALRKADDTTDIKDHNILKNENWKKIDKLLYSWDDMRQQGPILIAWTICRYFCLSKDNQQLTSYFGDSAMRCNVILFLRHILEFPSYKKSGDGVSCLIKSHVYIILSLLLKVFQEDTVGDLQNIVEIACRVLEEPILSSLFLMEDQSGGIGMLLKSTKKHFPFMVTPYVQLLKSLCADADSADIVFDSFESQETFTELFGHNLVDEIEAVDDRIWKRKTTRTVLEIGKDSISIEENVYGHTFQDKQDVRLVQWNFSYSGWLYALLELNKIIESPMTYTSGSGEDGLSLAKNYISLMASILNWKPAAISDFEPLIGTVIVLIKRISHLKSCPTELLAVCLKCLNFVMLKQPIEVWQHLTEIQFLPHQKNKDITTMLPGFYGNILTDVEIPNHTYDVTKEYLQAIMTLIELPCDALIKADKTHKLYMNLAVNIVLVIKEIFAHFGRWKFSYAQDKELIALKCLEIFHQLLSPKYEMSSKIKERNLPSLKGIARDGILHHGAGESLLAIISVGVDSLAITLDNDVRQGTDVIQVLKLSFAVLNQLFANLEKNATLTPLEEVLSQHFVQQPSDLDFMHPFCNMTMLSVVAKFIFHQQDPKLPILAVLTLRTLAVRFPLILTSSFGDALTGIRNAFVNRLNGRVEAVRLKVSILEFLSACVESQPGIIECFIHIQQNKDKSTGVGKFSCLPPILEILEHKEQIDVLTSTALEFVAALWKNRYDGAMTILKNSKTFWESVVNSLKLQTSSEIKAVTYEPFCHSLDIIATETYYIKSGQFDEQLKSQLTKLCTLDFYKSLLKIFEPSKDTFLHSKILTALKSFQVFVTVMTKEEEDPCSLGTKDVKDFLVSSFTKLFKQWVMMEGVTTHQNIIVEIANSIWLFVRIWKGTLADHQVVIRTLYECLTELSTSDRISFREVLFPSYMTILGLLQSQNKAVISEALYSSLMKLVVAHLQHHKEQNDGEECNFKEHIQVNITSVSLMTELIPQIPEEGLPTIIQTYQNHGTIQNLLQDMSIYLKKAKNIEYVEVLLRFLLSSSQQEKIAEHLLHAGIGKFICLSLHNVNMNYKSSQTMTQIWSSVIALVSRLLKKLKFSFLQVVIDFLGAYEESLFQSMNLMDEMASGTCLLVSEQLSILSFEISRYQHDVDFLLPDIHEKLKYGIAQMVKLSVALLSRQKLITHLTEFKSTDNIERVLRGFKTPSPISFRSDSVRSGFSTADLEKLTGPAEVAQNRLVNILCYCLGSMRRLTPNLVEAILDEGMDVDSFTPLVDFKFDSPTLEMDDAPTFGCLLACVNMSLKMIHKLVQGDSEHTTPERDLFNTSLSSDGDKLRSSLWFIVENALVVTLSQASCYLRHQNVDEGGKQFLKRELGMELKNIRYAVVRYRSRRGVPASPESSERSFSLSSSSTSFRRSPSKLSTSMSINEEDENPILRLVDTYTKHLLR